MSSRGWSFSKHNQPYIQPAVWGIKENFLSSKDITLMAVQLKDKSCILSGLDIQANRALFYVPITQIKIKGQEFLIFVTYLNKKEAILTILTNLQTINFYKLTRPDSLIP